MSEVKDYKEILSNLSSLNQRDYDIVCNIVNELQAENERFRNELECRLTWNQNAAKQIEQLKAENERLKQENEETKRFWYEHLEQEKELNKSRIEQYQQALRKCSPDDTDEIGYIRCQFCNGIRHTDDCEYIRLAGGNENV